MLIFLLKVFCKCPVRLILALMQLFDAFPGLEVCMCEVGPLLFYFGFSGLDSTTGQSGNAGCSWLYPIASDLLIASKTQNSSFSVYSSAQNYTYLMTQVC